MGKYIVTFVMVNNSTACFCVKALSRANAKIKVMELEDFKVWEKERALSVKEVFVGAAQSIDVVGLVLAGSKF